MAKDDVKVIKEFGNNGGMEVKIDKSIGNQTQKMPVDGKSSTWSFYGKQPTGMPTSVGASSRGISEKDWKSGVDKTMNPNVKPTDDFIK